MGETQSVHRVWDTCVDFLQDELPSQQFNTWIRPLTAEADGRRTLRLMAPNRFISDWVAEKYLRRIREIIQQHFGDGDMQVALDVLKQSAGFQAPPFGESHQPTATESPQRIESPQPIESLQRTKSPQSLDNSQPAKRPAVEGERRQWQPFHSSPESGDAGPAAAPQPIAPVSRRAPRRDQRSNLNPAFTFDSFVVGKSNQLGLAAARQVAENPGGSYNPLFIYGGVGLGKTHLMQSIGNALVKKNDLASVLYIHSERFLADMIKALQLNAMNDFKRYYRSVDALLIDDIQFLAGKDRSQEEFFHTFNALLEGGQQIILTCDRYPKEIDGLEERLKSRFGWGLTVAIEPPELETRVAILKKKAEESRMELSNDTAFFIAQRIRSNVRELEGALKRVIANAHFTGRPIDVDLVREALKDLLALQDKQVGIDNIQRVVADYYKIKISDLLSKRRNRSVARPRQVAMALAKELTNHSLPEIGDSFGGRDHTTVLHACRKIKSLREEDADIREDMKNLMRSLTT